MCVIPARYGSTRLPGKPLVDLGGKPMVVRSWERVRADLPAEQIIVATDDERVANVCRDYGPDRIRVEMTSPDCRTGTDRVAEVAERFGFPDVDGWVWVVAMGDNPLLPSGVIQRVVDAIRVTPPPNAVIGRARVHQNDVCDETVQKMVIDSDGNEMFASRRPIPYAPRDRGIYWKQVNVYAMWLSTLRKFAELPMGENEKRETLEILRLIEHGYKVQTVEVEGDGGSIDVPADVTRARRHFGSTPVAPGGGDETLPDYLL